jgi:Glycosyl transferases group 1
MTVDLLDTTDLDAHYGVFRLLADNAARHAATDRLESAATYVQMAAEYAWFNPVGLFASPELEMILEQLAATLPALRRAARVDPDPQRVLHVVTQVYQTGGPTQVISSWIEQDAGRRHRVCLTRQGAGRVPDKLRSRLHPSRGVVRVDTARGGLLDRAAALRTLAADADVVLVHSHPYDVVPSIAFDGVDGLPPVVFVNHADHVFWVGTELPGLVMSMRDSGDQLAVSRRGVDPARCTVMPRPLRLADRTMERAEAKRRLGLRPDRLLLVTAADAPKYRPVGRPSFLELVMPVLAAHPKVDLLAAGPAAEGVWAEAERVTAGRIRALGRLPDVSLLHEAADVYLDSFPFSSLTSLLEAGSCGTPAVTFRGHPEDCAVLGGDTRGVDEHLVRPADADTFRQELSALLVDAPARLSGGGALRDAIRTTHSGAGWQRSVAELYAAAAAVGPARPGRSVIRQTGRLDVLVDLVMAQTGFSKGEPGVVRDNLGLLDPLARSRAWLRLRRSGTPVRGRELLPEWALARAGRMRQRLQDLHRAGRRGSAAAALVPQPGGEVAAADRSAGAPPAEDGGVQKDR